MARLKKVLSEYGKGRCKVWAEATRVGDDILLHIWGGEKPHLGSASLCSSGEPTSISVPGHMDYVVSHEAAKRICSATGKRCLAIAGIHVDDASHEDIVELVENSRRCINAIINDLRK
ncbi:MAG: hypothetical protein NO516_00195 [Candidatus Methanomethylicia archaeon]|nr:hypothetical protein [Candidatus Methanomethylicia archaeon]